MLVDNTQSPPFTVHETSAELFYLLKFADKQDKFGFSDDLERNEALQWTFFWHGSGAPYQGQTNHFSRAAPEKIPYAIERFKNEYAYLPSPPPSSFAVFWRAITLTVARTLRVYGVLEIHLSGKYTGKPREYLAGKDGGKYSVADIKTWPWVKGWERTGFTKEEVAPFPHLLKWVDRIAQRPAVQRGIGGVYTEKTIQ